MKTTRPDFMEHTYRDIDIYVIDLDTDRFGGAVGLRNSSTDEEFWLPFWTFDRLDESERDVALQVRKCIDSSHEIKEKQHNSCYLLRRGDELAIGVTGTFFDQLWYSQHEPLELD